MSLRIMDINDKVHRTPVIIGDIDPKEGDAKINGMVIIVSLVYPNPKSLAAINDFTIENYGNYYIPKIHNFIKESEDGLGIKQDLIFNNVIKLNSEDELGNTIYKRIFYSITPEMYNYASKELNNEERTLDEDLKTGRFFDRVIHEKIAELFFNSEDYLEEIKDSGIIDCIKNGDLKSDCPHTFLIDKDILDDMIGSPIYDQKDLDRLKELSESIKECRNSLKNFTFYLGNKDTDVDITSYLVDALGNIKESILNLECAETLLLDKLHKQQSSEIEDDE